MLLDPFGFSSLYANIYSFYSSYVVGVFFSEETPLFTVILFSVSTVNYFLIAGCEDLVPDTLFLDF
jgi:hypothetical protein